MKVEGLFRLLSPLHCSSGASGNLTHIMKQRVWGPAGADEVPYFPGNDLRGRLRRKVAAMLMEHIAAERKLDIPTYVGMSCGDPRQGVETDNTTIEEILRSRENPLMGLFGGGCRILRGRLSICDLIPVLESTVEAGLVPKAFSEVDGGAGFLPRVTRKDDKGETRSEFARGWNIVERYTMFKVDDVFRVSRVDEMMEFLANPVETVAGYQAEEAKRRVQRKSDKEGTAAGVANMLQFEAIASGVPMYFRAQIAPGTPPASVGVFLLALRDLVREQALGGKVSHGLGRFSADLTIEVDGNAVAVFADSPASDQAELNPALEAEFLTPAREAIAGIAYDDVAAFFTPQKGAAKAKGSKKAAASA